MLQSEYRENGGKGVARKLRSRGLIPAIVYGHKEDPISLSVREIDLRKLLLLHGERAIIDLSVEGAVSGQYNAIVRDVQIHSASGKILHVDFQRISLDEAVRVEVNVVLSGDPIGVKDTGGILEHGLRSLNIVCVPAAIPDSIVIDVSRLAIGGSIHVSDIAANYPGIEFLDDLGSMLAIVVPPAAEIKPVEQVAEAPTEPELITREKKEEEGEEGKGKEAGKE